QLRTGTIRERVAVPGAFPAVARHLVGTPCSASRQHDRLCREQMESATLAVVPHRTGRTPVVEQQLDNGVLHVNGDAEVDRVVLQGANEFESRAIADMREPRIAMAAEIALVDPAIR